MNSTGQSILAHLPPVALARLLFLPLLRRPAISRAPMTTMTSYSSSVPSTPSPDSSLGLGPPLTLGGGAGGGAGFRGELKSRWSDFSVREGATGMGLWVVDEQVDAASP